MTKRAERGVYLIVNDSADKPVRYVGRSSKSITARLKYDHKPNGRFHPGIEYVTKFGIKDETRRNNVEARLIKKLKPPRNRKDEPVTGGIQERIGSWLDTHRIVKKVIDE